MMDNAPIIIIGSGLAGYNLAKEFRRLDKDTPLLLLTADDGSSYSKPMLSTGFTKGKSAEQLVMADAGKMADQLSMEIRTHSRVVAIDADQQQVSLDGGDQLVYSKLVLAWGAQAINPPIQGDGMDRVFPINDLEDYRKFCAAIAGKKRVVIMGAGLIGCEFANDLANGGYDVEIVAPCDQVLPTLLPLPLAEQVQQGLVDLGVKFHFGPLVTRVDVTRAEAQGESLAVNLSNGLVIEADAVVSAIGLRPNIELAVKAGLQVNEGICVDAYLQTNRENIYALGDCAEIDGRVMLYVMPLMTSARSLAKTLAGEPSQVKFGAMPVTVKTPSCPLVVLPPPKNAVGHWNVEGDGQDLKALFKNDQGGLLGFCVTGACVADKNQLAKDVQIDN